jgi:hypothetical protein
MCDRSAGVGSLMVTYIWTHERLAITAEVSIYPEDPADLDALIALPASILPAP